LRICDDAEGDVVGKGITLNNLGKAIYSQGRIEQIIKQTKQEFEYYEQALMHYEQALSLHRKQSDVREEANTLKNIGEVCDALRRREDAYAFYEQALGHFRAIGDRRGEGIVLNNLGVLHRKSNKNEEAFKCYEQAFCIFHKIGDLWGEADTLKSLGRFYGLHRVPPRYDIALACCLQAKTIFEGLGYPERGAIPRLVDATLRSGLGTQQFEALLAEVEPQVWRILEQTLPCL
jgi:tetratricopeptide (TPR) repeat protein